VAVIAPKTRERSLGGSALPKIKIIIEIITIYYNKFII